MTIRSYLVHVRRGDQSAVAARLRRVVSGDVIPAETHDLIVVVTETPDDEPGETIEAQLSAVAGVTAVSLVAGFAGA